MIEEAGTGFQIICFDGENGWKTVLDRCAPHLDQKGLDRLMPVLDQTCRCVVIEAHYIDKDYRDTFSRFYSKRFNTPSSRCLRLHFFRIHVTEEAIARQNEVQENDCYCYLGYSVIRPTKPNCIGRTMLSVELPANRNAHMSTCEEKVTLIGCKLTVIGFPYISQDSDATVCAESALWMLFRYYSNRYKSYPEILPFQITTLAERQSPGARIYPSKGLYTWQLAEAMRVQGFSPVTYHREFFPDNFDHLLYTYIESGLPLLIVLKEHVVVGYGHKSDYTRPFAPLKNKLFSYSSFFNYKYVTNDDNIHPYHTLLRSDLTIIEKEKIEGFIAPLPERVFLTAEEVQSAIEHILYGSILSIDKYSPSLKNEEIVLRLFLTTCRSFKLTLHERTMGHPIAERYYRLLPMPHFIWICEIGIYSEYTRKHKVRGEVIWDATQNAHDSHGLIAVHYPEELIADSGSAFNGVQNLTYNTLGNSSSPYPLYTSNLSTLYDTDK